MKPCYTNVTQLHFTSLKLVCSQLEASLKPVRGKFNFSVNEPLLDNRKHVVKLDPTSLFHQHYEPPHTPVQVYESGSIGGIWCRSRISNGWGGGGGRGRWVENKTGPAPSPWICWKTRCRIECFLSSPPSRSPVADPETSERGPTNIKYNPPNSAAIFFWPSCPPPGSATAPPRTHLSRSMELVQ